MRTAATKAALGAAMALAGQAAAQETTPLILPSQSTVYNQTSVNLPAPPVAYGQDLVRAADGVSCQSAIGSGGPYLDVGVTRSTDVFDRGSQAVYGRVVMPLGRKPRRVDCTRLYELEIARMKLEVEMLRMGAKTTALHAAPMMPMGAPQAARAAGPAEVPPTVPHVSDPPEGTSLPRPRLKPEPPTPRARPVALAQLERHRGLR